jgi:flavin-dependent dehydrogenase
MDATLRDRYDVCICGGGLAGLTLSQYLRQRMPELSLIVVEPVEGPLPAAAHKVGESTVEVGAAFLSEVLGLKEHLDQAQLPKLGLRYFMAGSHKPLHERPEMGIDSFSDILVAYQLDRGVLENHLRHLTREQGIDLVEGWKAKEVLISEGENDHTVVLQDRRADQFRNVAARWVVDATGRRRLLQKQLGLSKRHGFHCNSVWFRVPGRLDIEDFVSEEVSAWHERVPGRKRYYSTNHLMGRGYWVWLIPLGSGHTSVGIVAADDIHPFKTYGTRETALDWLRTHEPEVASRVEGMPWLDFLKLNNYSHSALRAFSAERWACVGEAAAFNDPFYSPGTDFISLANIMVAEIIRLDRERALPEGLVDQLSQSFLTAIENSAITIQSGLFCYGNPKVAALKILWDFCSTAINGWAVTFGVMFQDRPLSNLDRVALLFSPERAKSLEVVSAMPALFVEWAKRSEPTHAFDFIDYIRDVAVFRELGTAGRLAGRLGVEELRALIRSGGDRLEELAQVVFKLAVEDVLPGELGNLPSPLWINPAKVSLDPTVWGDSGLFQPMSVPRDYSQLEGEIRSLFEGRSGVRRQNVADTPARALEKRITL